MEAKKERDRIGDNNGGDRGSIHTQQRPNHVRKRKQQQRPPPKRVHRPDGRPRKGEVDEAEAEGGEERRVVVDAALLEDGGAVEADDVDAAHLLRGHDDARGPRRPAHARHGEELGEAREHVSAPPPVPRRFGTAVSTASIGNVVAPFTLLLLQEAADVVQVPSRLDRRVAQPEQRLPRPRVPLLLDVPPRALGAKVRPRQQGDGRDEGRAELQPPRERAGLADGQVGARAQEDAC